DLSVSGPVWARGMVEEAIVERVGEELPSSASQDSRRISELLRLEADLPPLYYNLDRVASFAGLPTPAVEAVLKELRRRGFAAGRTHADPKGVKTDAEIGELLEVLRDLSRGTR
ncbi:MAG: hypothetical protein DRO06_00255, partial [Thermoproteota archaeon]